jgi:hypothetical protein
VLIRPTTNPDHAVATNWRASYGTGNPGGTDGFTYASWKSSNAPGQADGADADNDGLTTFWEYVHGGIPGACDTHLLPTGALELLVVGLQTDFYPTLTVTLRVGADDLQLFPESAANLTAWSGTDMVLLRQLINADGTETMTWRHARPFKADSRVMMRLRVIMP